jgi:hypothetical protein
MKPCCNKFRKYTNIIDGSLALSRIHGVNPDEWKGITFVYCPWCGKKKVKE